MESSHLSLYWVNQSNSKIISQIEDEFCGRLIHAMRQGSLKLPPIPDVVIRLQQLCLHPDTTIRHVATCLLDDAALTANVIKAANSAMFSPRTNIECNDINMAVSRLGLKRIHAIAMAYAVDKLKKSATFSKACNDLLKRSAVHAREFAATMALVCQTVNKHSSEPTGLEMEKALLVGLLADIGLFSLVDQFQQYNDEGNYLDLEIAGVIFKDLCKDASRIVLRYFEFDEDYVEVATNNTADEEHPHPSYLDVARMANHLLMFRKNDEAIDDHDVELNLAGAEALYELSNLKDDEFSQRLTVIVQNCGF